MKLLRIVPLALALALVAAVPFVAAADPDPAKPEYELKNPKVMLERWESVFAEGTKVGSKHTTVTQHKIVAETFYLFEEVYEAQFGTERISITRQAQTDNAYMLKSFYYLSDTAAYKVENYGVPIEKGDDVFVKHTVTDKSAGKVVQEIKKTVTLPRALPLFATADIFCLDYRMRMSPQGRITAFDLSLMQEANLQYEYKAGGKVKIGGVEQSLAELILKGGDGLDVSYYVDDNQDKTRPNDIKFVRYRNMPLSASTVAKDAARVKSGTDPDFVADTHLENNTYKDTDRGIVFTRPSEAWLVRRQDLTGNVSLIALYDMIGMQTAYCVVITHTPPALGPDQLEVCTRRLIANISQGTLKLPAPGPSRTIGSVKIYQKTDKVPSDFTGRVDQYYCLQNNGRAVGIVMVSPAYIVKPQETLVQTFLQSWIISKVLLPSPPKTTYAFPGGFVKIDGYHPSWAITTSAAGNAVSLFNDVLGVAGEITGGPQPVSGASPNSIIAQNLKGIPRPKTADIEYRAKVGQLDAIAITSYGDTPDGKMCYKVYIVLGQRNSETNAYRVMFKIPMDVQGAAMEQVNYILNKAVFKMK